MTGGPSLDDILKHCIEFAKIRSCEAYSAEKFRQQAIQLKILLLEQGVAEKDIATWVETVMGINVLSSLVPDELGKQILDFIDKKGRSHEQLRQFVMDTLFYHKTEV